MAKIQKKLKNDQKIFLANLLKTRSFLEFPQPILKENVVNPSKMSTKWPRSQKNRDFLCKMTPLYLSPGKAQDNYFIVIFNF